MSTISVTVGITKFCLRVAFNQRKALNTPLALKANELVRQKTLVELEVTQNISKFLPM